MKKLLFGILGLLVTISAFAGTCNYTITTGVSTQSGTPTPDNPVEIISTTQGDITLRSVGNVADTYNASTGVVTRNIGIVYLKDVNWSMSGKGPGRFFSNTYFKTIRAGDTGGLSNIFLIEEIELNSSNQYTEGKCTFMATSATDWVNSIYCSWNIGNTTLEQFQAMLESTNAYILYVMAEPTYENVGKTYTCHATTTTCANYYDKDNMTVQDITLSSLPEIKQGSSSETVIVPIESNKTYTIAIIGGTNMLLWRAGTAPSGTIPTTATAYRNLTAYEPITLTSGSTDKYLYIQVSNSYTDQVLPKLMVVEGDTVPTTYAAYDSQSCAINAIKIATTAYNSARFSPVVTELNDTIATIRSVVTNTINQTKAIADLQATKQTRPDENCPAGKKCLLVEDDAGQPHWYEIIESANRLPDGYTELQYIESTGTQYIDTGFTPNQDTRWTLDVLVPTADTSAFSFGSATSGSFTPGFGVYGGNTTYLYGSIYGGEDFNPSSSGRFQAGTRYSLDLNKNIFTITTSSVIYTHTHSVQTFTAPATLKLFNLNVSNNRFGKFRMYLSKIWDNNTLVRDFVPAKNSSGVIGMYDTVSGRFFTNAGSGTFVEGPEI